MFCALCAYQMEMLFSSCLYLENSGTLYHYHYKEEFISMVNWHRYVLFIWNMWSFSQKQFTKRFGTRFCMKFFWNNVSFARKWTVTKSHVTMYMQILTLHLPFRISHKCKYYLSHSCTSLIVRNNVILIYYINVIIYV